MASEIHRFTLFLVYKVRDICLKFYEQVIGLTRMQKLVKENEGFFILKLVASEIHSHFVSMNKFRSDENAETCQRE